MTHYVSAISVHLLWKDIVSLPAKQFINSCNLNNVNFSHSRHKYRCCGRCAFYMHVKSAVGLTSLVALLVIRTWAFWQRSKKLLIGLLVYGVLSIIAAIAADLTPTMLIPGEEPPLGTCYFESTRNAAIVYLILAIFESVMLILNVYKRVHDYKEFESGLVVTLYHGGMFYMVCILAVTLANVIFEGALPSAYSNMFNSLQLVVHSVLASRILFRLRDSNERVRVPSMLVMTLDAQVN
ncbi:hypothetical protein EV424DRAFT_920846 [Suillus variegatus]|nr:hypothetical protein EV424DRAFT_920846 [Suillus variegatus]